MLKILFNNRPKSSWIGGDYKQMEATAEALRDLGHTVEINEKNIYLPAQDFLKFDIIHLWNFSMAWTKPQMGIAMIHKKPIVCSMIYHQTDRFVTYPEQRFMAANLDKAIFLNKGELKRLNKKVKIKDEKVMFLANGIDSKFFRPYKKGTYILTVGRISEFKGQLEVAKACKKLKLEYHIVGEVEDMKYMKECVKAGAVYRGVLEGEELIEEYGNCLLYILASKNELMPLTVMEAGAQGKQIVLTTGSEWQPEVYYCKHGSVGSIKKAILAALKEIPNKALYKDLKKMTWQNVAKVLDKTYKEIIKSHDKPTDRGNQLLEGVSRKKHK